jgi:hypothetical protein
VNSCRRILTSASSYLPTNAIAFFTFHAIACRPLRRPAHAHLALLRLSFAIQESRPVRSSLSRCGRTTAGRREMEVHRWSPRIGPRRERACRPATVRLTVTVRV